jgi:hypothetical protein
MNLTRYLRVYFPLSIVLASCSSLGSINVEDGRLPVSNGLEVVITSYADNRSSVSKDGKIFAPYDKDKVICVVNVNVNNSTGTDLHIKELDGIEAVFIDAEGKLVFARSAPLIDFDSSHKDVTFKGGVSQNGILYFVHDKGIDVVAITNERLQYVLLMPENDPSYGTVVTELEKYPKILELFDLAQVADFNTVNTFRLKNNLDIDAENIQGLTLLYVGILSGNNSIVEGAVANGANIYKQTFLGMRNVAPIHAAVMINNKYAIKVLLDNGCDINKETDGFWGASPVITAIEAGNLDALKTLAELGVDVNQARKRNTMGSISALSYARNLKQTEIVEYLESLQ